MPPILLPFVTTLALAACAVGAARDSAPLPDGVRCTLDLSARGGLVSLTARATSPTAQAIHWGLTAATPGGNALINQGGSATLPAGQDLILSDIALTAPGGQITADLTLTVAGRSLTCPVVPQP
jgi:hypothetical protein